MVFPTSASVRQRNLGGGALGLALKGRVTSPGRTERQLQEEGMPHKKALR